jgi:hypothetical protein
MAAATIPHHVPVANPTRPVRVQGISEYEWLHTVDTYVAGFEFGGPVNAACFDVFAMRTRALKRFYKIPRPIDHTSHLRSCNACNQSMAWCSLVPTRCWCGGNVHRIPPCTNEDGYRFLDLGGPASKWVTELPRLQPGARLLNVHHSLRFYGTLDSVNLDALQMVHDSERQANVLEQYTCNYHSFARTLQRHFRQRCFRRTFRCLAIHFPLPIDLAYDIVRTFLGIGASSPSVHTGATKDADNDQVYDEEDWPPSTALPPPRG